MSIAEALALLQAFCAGGLAACGVVLRNRSYVLLAGGALVLAVLLVVDG